MEDVVELERGQEPAGLTDQTAAERRKHDRHQDQIGLEDLGDADEIAFTHGVEGRPVGCLGDLDAIARSLPEAWLVGPDGEGKRALRAALKGSIPESVRTDTRKRGFPTPFARAARGVGRDTVEGWIRDRRTRERGWWNVDACLRLLDDERPAYDRALFAMLSWEWWARWFLDGDAFA